MSNEWRMNMKVLERESPGAVALEARRLAAYPRIQQGESLSAIARSLGVSRQAVHQWAQKIRQRGAKGLQRRKRSGRPSKLSHGQLAQLDS